MVFSPSWTMFAAGCALSAVEVGCDEGRLLPADGGGPQGVTISSSARPSSARANADAASLVGSALDGCLRTGAIEAAAADPTCVIDRVREDVMRDAPRRLALTLAAEPPETAGGATSLLRLAITNVASTETLVVLEAIPASSAPRPDWTRIAGMPEVRGASLGLHVPLTVTTLDARELRVDATPMTSAPPGAPKLLAVRLRPSGKLTHVASWWALRIPAPAAIFKDDAGHVNVPKTLPLPLDRGDYLVRVEVPLFGVPLAERTVTTRIHVDEAPRGLAHPH